MSSFADQLKSEIARIARKEVRAETRALKKANAQYRTDIAALKRRLAEAERALARVAKGAGKAAPKLRKRRAMKPRPHRACVFAWPALPICAKSWACLPPKWAS